MKVCPITYEKISQKETYSKRGLHELSPQLNALHPLPLTAHEQREEAMARAGKMSLQGVQKKLSAQLKIKDACFSIVDQGGHYILKMQSDHYTALPENEAITMTLAKIIGLDVPPHGLISSKDGSMTYFIKRFDRAGRHKKIAVEDFAQLSGMDRDTKYNSSMEKVAEVITRFCTFPLIEHVKLLKLTLFNFLIGNEDMHLKNFSLVTRDQKVVLSPPYDLLNSTIALKQAKEELALPLNGKKSNLRKKDFIDYFAMQRLGLNQNIVNRMLSEIARAIPQWEALIKVSFLSKSLQERYLDLLAERWARMMS